jgi:hypothetical protein
VVGDGVTTRTLNFAAYRGGQGALEDVGASSKEYILSAYCVSSSASAYILKATQANP